MKGMPGGMHQMMKQVNQMQARIKKLQEELSQKEYDFSSGGEAVKIKVNGENKILDLKISEELVKSQDKEMLQDLITVALNEALKKVKETSSQEMDKITGGLQIPGMF